MLTHTIAPPMLRPELSYRMLSLLALLVPVVIPSSPAPLGLPA